MQSSSTIHCKKSWLFFFWQYFIFTSVPISCSTYLLCSSNPSEYDRYYPVSTLADLSSPPNPSSNIQLIQLFHLILRTNTIRSSYISYRKVLKENRNCIVKVQRSQSLCTHDLGTNLNHHWFIYIQNSMYNSTTKKK